MNVYIHQIETLVPPHASTQNHLGELFARWAGDAAQARVVRHIFRRSGIQRRHSVVPDFTDPASARLFRPDETGRVQEPSTQARNRVYGECAAPLAVELARRLLAGAEGFHAREVTHVITVSCTGFVNPGPDWSLVTALGLPPTVERYQLGFMGCYAALPALRMARQFCLARPEAVVLIVCLELCSLHMQLRRSTDSILGNALFSDGVAGVLVSARTPLPGRPVLALHGFMAALAPEGRGEMAWEIGDHGFNLVLSSYVPDVIGANLGRIVPELLAAEGLTADAVDRWAVHPGGKAILDKVETTLGLDAAQLAASRAVLRDYGNMSSATILFVLEQMLQAAGAVPQTVAAMAFGPGLTIECGLLETVPARSGPGAQPRPAAVAA